MSDLNAVAVDVDDAKAAEPADRREAMLQLIESLGGPSPAEIEVMRSNSPGGRIRVFSLDNRRYFIVRSISGMELATIQKGIPTNSTDPEKDIQIGVASLCTLWTNSTVEKKLSEAALRFGPAGLPSSIWALVAILSDFADPADFQTCSVEL